MDRRIWKIGAFSKTRRVKFTRILSKLCQKGACSYAFGFEATGRMNIWLALMPHRKRITASCAGKGGYQHYLNYYSPLPSQIYLQSRYGFTFQYLCSVLADSRYPVPPLPEQRRIVDKIEELFSNLDAGVASLKTARRQVDRYRQSVLQAAVEGRLTADWRQSHAPEPAEELLERILEERRKQWEKDYRAKYEAKGKEPPSGWKKRYKEPESPDTEDLSALPEGWIWTNTDSISTVYGGVTKNSSERR